MPNKLGLIFLFLTFLLYIQSQSTSCRNHSNYPVDRRYMKGNDNTTLTIGTFNAEWLFVDNFDRVNYPPNNLPWWNNPAMAKDHLKAMAKVIKEIDCDILS